MKKQIVLQVNRADAGEQMQVNITAKAGSIERVEHNGRPHWKVSSATLPFDVIMNGGLYPRSEIEANYKSIDGTAAPLGHPQVNGKFVPARSPEGINAGWVGAWNSNAHIEGNRVRVDKMIDIEVAERSPGGAELLERLEAASKGEGDPISTSVAVMLERLEPNEAQAAMGAQWVAKIHSIDHDAILLHEPPAATPEQGVGMMVNADQAQPIAANSGALVGESFREREQRLDQAAKQRWVTGDEYVWVADFTDSQAVIVRNGGVSEVYGYEDKGGVITFADTGAPVVRQESWVTTVANSVANSLKRFFNQQARPAVNKEGDMPLTPEERADLVKDIGAAVTPIVNAAVADAIKPIAEKVDGLETNVKATADAITANARAEEAEKRKAVAAVHGDVVANALSGEPLDAMFKSLGTAAALGANSAHASTGLTADVANLPKE